VSFYSQVVTELEQQARVHKRLVTACLVWELFNAAQNTAGAESRAISSKRW